MGQVETTIRSKVAPETVLSTPTGADSSRSRISRQRVRFSFSAARRPEP